MERWPNVPATARRAKRVRRGVVATLRLSHLHSLAGELGHWRTSTDVKELAAAKGSAIVLPFVKGLRLSAQLIYLLRKELRGMGLEVDWGHLVDDAGDSCSPECDIIIHRCGSVDEWDGSEKPVMHFKFVKQSCAQAVVSCKSFADDVDVKYVTKLRSYVRRVFLLAECCAPQKVASLRKRAREAGYAAFAILYTFNEKTGERIIDEEGWLSFLDTLKAKIKRRRRA